MQVYDTVKIINHSHFPEIIGEIATVTRIITFNGVTDITVRINKGNYSGDHYSCSPKDLQVL